MRRVGRSIAAARRGAETGYLRPLLIDWWRRRGWTSPRMNQVVWCASEDDVPTKLSRHNIAVIGKLSQPKWALLVCPCGHGHTLRINLSPRRKPCWRLDVAAGVPSVAPSIDYEDAQRRCHFWLRGGKVIWS